MSHLFSLNAAIWLLLGLIAVSPLLGTVHQTSLETAQKILGVSLVITALAYVAFALVGGEPIWLLIEAVGIVIYGSFYWLAQRFSLLWLAVGWLLHPLWDVLLHLWGPGHHIAPDWYAVACVSFDLAVAVYILCQAVSSQSQPT